MPNFSESVPELVNKVSKAKTKDEKIFLLQGYKNTQALHTVLQGAFHPDVVWDLPEGSPPYKKDDSEYGLAPSILEREVRKLVYFTSFSGKLIQNKMKREEIFINMLEAMHPSESELVIQMKDKNIEGLLRHTHQYTKTNEFVFHLPKLQLHHHLLLQPPCDTLQQELFLDRPATFLLVQRYYDSERCEHSTHGYAHKPNTFVH